MTPGSLQRCQVATPPNIVDFMWRLALERRKQFATVGDLGAGDGRFARWGKYGRYLGYEIDPSRCSSKLPIHAKLKNSDAFLASASNFDLVIGNPPYVKGAELDPEWRERVCVQLEEQLGIEVARNANLYVYFMMLALIKTRAEGLVVQLVPYEWVSRPSARSLRELIRSKGWSVNVYRFEEEIFDRVLTTASVSIIDKSTSESNWRYFSLDASLTAADARGPSGSRTKVLDYERRAGKNYCLRGLSPGGQDIFVLTEHDRVLHGLKPGDDVYPAVTTLRDLPDSVESLTSKSFEQHFVGAGAQCWLIRSDVDQPSRKVKAYLDSVPNVRWEKYSTCTERDVWWRYKCHPPAPILMASGFRDKRPKIVTNGAQAIACGSVYGVFAERQSMVTPLRDRLRDFDFGKRVVSHANGLRKLEVNQVNAALSQILK